MLTCSRCGKQGGPLVCGGRLPGPLCMGCVDALGVRPEWARRRRTFSVTPKRAAYVEAGEPYGRNRKGLKRWLRALVNGALEARQTFYLWTDAGRRFFYYVCEGCDSRGRLGVPVDMLTPFGCPDGCGATYVSWVNPTDGPDLMCVVKPIRISMEEVYESIGIFDDDGEDEPDIDECGMTAGGGCTLAGTEFCDWECPYGS